MATPKNPGRPVSLRVKPGSALERLTASKSFTDAVHALAERYEVMVSFPMGRHVETIARDEQQPVIQSTAREVLPPEQDPTEELGYKPRELPKAKVEQMYRIPSEDGLSYVEVNEEEALRIMKAQTPAGLEPVLDAYMIASEAEDLGEPGAEPEQVDFDYEALA
jgi:hypothetical protein